MRECFGRGLRLVGRTLYRCEVGGQLFCCAHVEGDGEAGEGGGAGVVEEVEFFDAFDVGEADFFEHLVGDLEGEAAFVVVVRVGLAAVDHADDVPAAFEGHLG